MSIPTQTAIGVLTNRVIRRYNEKATATRFLQSFASDDYSPTKLVSVAVVRDQEKIAVDVERGTEGRRNKFSHATVRDYMPPLYDEYFDATELDVYDTLFGAKDIEEKAFKLFYKDVTAKLDKMEDKIVRAKELQWAQVLETGVVSLVNGDDINYNRQAGSMVANSATNTWATSTVDPYDNMGDRADWIRQNGLSNTHTFDVILGKNAVSDFFNNAKVLARNDLKQVKLDNLSMPRPVGPGAKFHGEVTIGEYTARLWSYPQYYKDANNVMQPYWNPNKYVILADDVEFVTAHAAVPQLLTKGGMMLQQGPYLPYDYPDYRNASHDFGIKSAPLAVPVTIDKFATEEVVAPAS